MLMKVVPVCTSIVVGLLQSVSRRPAIPSSLWTLSICHHRTVTNKYQHRDLDWRMGAQDASASHVQGIFSLFFLGVLTNILNRVGPQYAYGHTTTTWDLEVTSQKKKDPSLGINFFRGNKTYHGLETQSRLKPAKSSLSSYRRVGVAIRHGSSQVS